MNDTTDPPQKPLSCRRAGIDRRWIKISDFQPERRSGQDRRDQQRQQTHDFSQPLNEPSPKPLLSVTGPLETDPPAVPLLEESVKMPDASGLSEEERQTELFYLLFRYMRF